MQHEWREGNRVILLPEASRFLPAMFEAVSQAQHYVLVELYLMESGELANQVIDALAAATRRGVKTYLLLDAMAPWGWSEATVNVCRQRAWPCSCSTDWLPLAGTQS